IDELMHPHLPIPPRYQNWTIEEEEALCDDDKKHGIRNWISILSDSQLALAKLMDPNKSIKTSIDMSGKGATYARSWLKVAQEGAQTC
ncbi:ulp1 protease family catalytic domain, homeodomain-like protein, partial [Tanacetum coccineum]